MSVPSTGHEWEPNGMLIPEYPWDPNQYFTEKRLLKYFCKRIQPKLSELDEFKSQDLSSYEAQKEAIIRLIKWPDDGRNHVSKEFREFYDGLLFYRNVDQLLWYSEFRQLIEVLFEIHGSDPRNFPGATKISIRLLNDVLKSCTLQGWMDMPLWDVLDAGSIQGSHAAIMLRSYLEHHKREWEKSEWGCSAPCNPFSMLESGKMWMRLPLHAGFSICCDGALNSCHEDIRAFLKRDMMVNSELPAADSETGGYVQILVGPSGCGKTSKIHSLLKEHWGLYLLPGNLPKGSYEVEMRDRLECKPRRCGGSRDTQTWLDDAKSVSEYSSPFPTLMLNRALRLMQARIWILEQFRAICPNCTPSDWLSLQTNCNEPQNDIFNRLYRVARFTTAEHISRPKADEVRPGLIFCFDEAQCDLEASFPNLRTWPKSIWASRVPVEPLSYMINAALAVSLFHFRALKTPGICLSGTALQLRDIRRVIDREASNIQILSKISAGGKLFTDLEFAPKVNQNFQLIENETDFKNLAQAGGYCNDDKRLVNMIIQHSKPLRGRIAWSVCYLDETRKLIQRRGCNHTKVLDKDVKEVSMKVCEMAKQGLMGRLEEMRRRKEALCQHSGRYNYKRLQYKELMDELCSLAIRSDLLGEAAIFKSSESVDLVALGFAFLEEPQESDVSRVRLKERLAVDAAIEYFQSQKPSSGQSEYDRALINFLYDQQSSASALGKVAELFFAWHLRKVLGTRPDIILPTFGDDYLTQVIQLLIGKAHTVEHHETGNRKSGVENNFANHAKCGDLTEFRLVEGRRTAYQEEFEEKRTITMWEWLRNIRMGSQEDELQSTFWFPSNNTGPDILFALRRKTPKATTSLPHHYRTRQRAGEKRKRNLVYERELDYSLVLCAVQIKREKRISDVGRAIATTDPNYWFSQNYPHHPRDALEITKELREWQKGRYPIVRILVSALADPSQYRKAEEGPTTAEKYFRNKAVKTNQKSSEDTLVEEGRSDDLQKVRIPPHQQYFTSIGAEHDDLLFGDAFRRLRIAQGIQTTRERRGEA